MFIHLLYAAAFLILAYRAAPNRDRDQFGLIAYWLGLMGFATQVIQALS